MRKVKITTSITADQSTILRGSAPSPRKVGERIGNVAEVLQRDWMNATQQLEHKQHWSRKQIEHAASAIATYCLMPFDPIVLAAQWACVGAPDPKDFSARIHSLPLKCVLFLWQIGRELKLGNPEVEQYLAASVDTCTYP